MKKIKTFVKKYHLDYLAITAGSVAVGALVYKLHMSHLFAESSGDGGIGVEPYTCEGFPGIRMNLYDYLEDGKQVLSDRLVFNRECYDQLHNICLECFEEALQKKAENE